MFQIFIPSKQRENNSPVIERALFEKLNFFVVVEKEDYINYKKRYPNVKFLVLEKNNQGISYVRNFILNYCRENKIEWFWMIDDDILNFFKVENKINIKINMKEALEESEKIFLNEKNIGQASLEYQQIAWSCEGKNKFNSYCDVCVCINSEISKPIKYDPYFNGKEDREFTIKLILAKLKTIRITKYSFGAPKNGSNKGGLSEIFYKDKKKELEVSKKLTKRYSKGLCYINIKKDGRPDCKINWSLIKDEKMVNNYLNQKTLI